ncbi:hypothetical protein F0562_016723 [Nyssa sinensis]|uniref:DUF4378 domain-containing protein n=1 Tax=Nyssa sinensis TaxID=561372 RepID=A0A5J4ZD99_9ASTE|nr:hypothetical protein F0562_016723 [Nyssa sinensis]
MDSLPTEEKAIEPKSESKSSVKSRIKALIYEEKSKRWGRHRRSSSCPTQTQPTQTNSIHRLEASNMDPPAEVALNNESPKKFHHDNGGSSAATTLDQLQSKSCETSVASNDKCDLCATMLAVNYLRQGQFRKHGKQSVENHTLLLDKLNEVKQDLLEKKLIYVKEPIKDVSLHESKQFLDAQDIFDMNKELLLKILQDPSSPLAHESYGRQASNSRGLTKSMSFPLAGSSDRRHVGPSKLAEAEAEQRMDGIPKPYLARPVSFDNSSPGSPHGLKNQHENKMAIKHFKNLKQKIKHAIRESRKEKHRITMDAVLHKIPYGRRLSKNVKEEMADLRKEPSMEKCSKYGPRSSNENDQSVPALGKENPKISKSGRLKLRTEEEPSPGWSAPKSLGRILSLPDLRSYSYLQNEGSPDATSSGIPSRTVVNEEVQQTSEEVGELYPAMKDEVGLTLLANDEAESKVGQTVDNLGNLTTGEISTHNEHEISPTAKLAERIPISVLHSNFQEDITSPAMFPISEDLGLKPGHLLFHGMESLDSLANQQLEAGMDSPTAAKSSFNLEKIGNSHQAIQWDEFLGTWHSADQPLDPSMFEEVEGCLLPDPNCPGNEEGGSCYHLLLFDLINEILLEVHERSFTYWPMPLSSCSHIRPMPAGYHVLEEVWANISCYLSWRPEVEQSLDDAVSRDLAKGDGWMNLQFDAECVGLELEDMILDDLLDELIWT